METNLNRTFHPKYTTYQSDGGGRDTYVLSNNGTMCKPSVTNPHTGFQAGILSPVFFTKNRSNMGSPKKEAMTFHYAPDGTGRDGYVIRGDGGLHANYKSIGASKTFVKSLRDYSQNRYAESGRDFFKSRTKAVSPSGIPERASYHPWYPEKIRKSLKESANLQEMLCQRLSSPKVTRNLDDKKLYKT